MQIVIMSRMFLTHPPQQLLWLRLGNRRPAGIVHLVVRPKLCGYQIRLLPNSGQDHLRHSVTRAQMECLRSQILAGLILIPTLSVSGAAAMHPLRTRLTSSHLPAEVSGQLRRQQRSLTTRVSAESGSVGIGRSEDGRLGDERVLMQRLDGKDCIRHWRPMKSICPLLSSQKQVYLL